MSRISCRADGWFLAWATPNHLQRINPLALVEVTYSFVAFYSHVVRDLADPPREVHFRIDLRNMRTSEPKASLAPGGFDALGHIFELELHEAPGNDATLPEVIAPPEFEPPQIAYRLLREVYLWFGFNEEEIPYVARGEGLPRVDIAEIKAR